MRKMFHNAKGSDISKRAGELPLLLLCCLLLFCAGCEKKPAVDPTGESGEETGIGGETVKDPGTKPSEKSPAGENIGDGPQKEPQPGEKEPQTEQETEPEKTGPEFFFEEPEAEGAERIRIFATANVNVRKEPSTSGKVLVTVPKGTSVEKLGVSDDGEWFYVNTGEFEGYMNCGYAVETVVPSGGRIALISSSRGTADPSLEPEGKNSSVMAQKRLGRAVGSSTGIREDEMTDRIALLLKEELKARGYSVMWIDADTGDLSRREQAEIAGDSGASAVIYLGAVSSPEKALSGGMARCTGKDDPYTPGLETDSLELATCLVNNYSESTGRYNRGVLPQNSLPELNWCRVPSAFLELGYFSNEGDEAFLSGANDAVIVKGIADGLDAYYSMSR